MIDRFQPFLGWLLSRHPLSNFPLPNLQGFNFQGGLRLTPEFAGMFIGPDNLYGSIHC